ncbi:MAG: hypothetical protein K6T61_18080 [Bryobacteraceae bacterium]|nr:hypothetical protein [Bryobacteraceae bacterium]
MATVNGPLFSLDASGTIARTAVYAKWKGRNYVRSHAVPANPQTDLQRSRRALIQFLSRAWSGLSALQQALWKPLASENNYSPFNAYTAYNSNRWTQGLGPQITPNNQEGNPGTFLSEMAAGGVGRATYFYQMNAANKNDDWGIFVAVHASLAVTPDLTKVKAGAVTIADGTQYRIDVLNLAPGNYKLAAYPFVKSGSVRNASTVFDVTVT